MIERSSLVNVTIHPVELVHKKVSMVVLIKVSIRKLSFFYPGNVI